MALLDFFEKITGVSLILYKKERSAYLSLFFDYKYF